MTIRPLSLLALSLVLWSSPGVAGRQSFHTRFFFSGGAGKSYWTETAPTTSSLGSAGGWSCTAGPIELAEMIRGHIVKTADINCIDANGSEAKVTATCSVAEDDDNSEDVLLRMKNAQQVHVAISCNTTKR